MGNLRIFLVNFSMNLKLLFEKRVFLKKKKKDAIQLISSGAKLQKFWVLMNYRT